MDVVNLVFQTFHIPRWTETELDKQLKDIPN